MQEEVWKDIADYEGCYQVSNLGNVRSLTRRVSSFRPDIGKRFEYDKKGQLIHPIASAGGYLTVVLSKDGKKSTFLVHELVACAFLEKKDGFLFIEHKNGIFTDNAVSNLKWSKEDESGRPKVSILNSENDNNDEQWRDVVGYETLYEVSTSGLVRSKKRVLKYVHNMSKLPCCTVVGGRILKGSVDNSGYVYVNLRNEEGLKRVSVHRLVAMAFIPNHENKPHIDHINTIKTDNRVENLRWVDALENINNLITIQHFHRDNGKNTDERSVYDLRKSDKFHNGIDLRNVENTAKLSFRKKNGAFLEISVKDGRKVCDFWFSENSLVALRDEINEYIESTKRITL